MSTTRTNNGSITLKSFAELGSVLDLNDFPEGPEDPRDPHAASNAATSAVDASVAAPDNPRPDIGLADVLAQLARMSDGLEAMTRDDARVRDEAALELARYEALAAETNDAERSLAEARRVRAAAESLAAEAFSDETRRASHQHAAHCRALELACLELLAARRRSTHELASSPSIARMLTERQRRADERAEADRVARQGRVARLADGLAAVDAALSANELDLANERIRALTSEFLDDADVRRRLDVVRWRQHNRLVAPAEDALRDLARRHYRDDSEAALKRLANIQTDGLPEDLARRVFGIWSNICWRVVQLRGWTDPRRDSRATSRGAIWARTPGGAYEVVSSLGDPHWRAGDTVADGVADRAPVLLSSSARGLRARQGPAA
jgi:hypothetical protein